MTGRGRWWARQAVVAGVVGALCAGLPGCGAATQKPGGGGDGSAALRCPMRGGAPWLEMRSPHFIMKTDQPARQSKVILVAMEVLHAALLTAMQAEQDRPLPPVEVVLFDRREDFVAITGRGDLGGFASRQLPGDVEPSPVIVTSGKLSYATRSTLVHELVHQVLHHRTGHLPWWLDEGLAEYYSTLWVRDAEAGVALAGDPPLDIDFGETDVSWIDTDTGTRTAKRWLPVKEAPTLNALLSVTRATLPAEKSLAYYAASWKLMHVLAGHRDSKFAPRFWNMLSRLSDGAPGKEAFEKAFEDISLLEIAGAYDQMLLDHREYPVPVKFFPPPEPQIEEREMGDGEVHALWARILAGQPTAQNNAEGVLESGEYDDPASVPLRYARASILLQTAGSGSVHSDVRLLLEREPENPRYLLVALLEARRAYRDEKNGPRKDKALRRVQGLASELSKKAVTGAQQSLTGAVFGEIGEPEKAVALVEKSTKTDPACGSCFGIQAQVSFATGELDRAEEAAQRALRLLSDGARARDLEELLFRIEQERRKRPKGRDLPVPGGAPKGAAPGP